MGWDGRGAVDGDGSSDASVRATGLEDAATRARRRLRSRVSCRYADVALVPAQKLRGYSIFGNLRVNGAEEPRMYAVLFARPGDRSTRAKDLLAQIPSLK
jgi:hypothetical protein